ncbi:unnamed protein product, partial [Effrenium voratum]
MEQLRILQQKSALLVKLRSDSSLSAQEESCIAETLLAMQHSFGEETLQRLKLLRSYLPLLEDQALAELLPAPAPAAPTAPVAPAAPGACHVTIEGVDLAQSALEDFASSYFMFHGLETSPGNLLKFLPFLGFLEGHLYCLDQQNEDSLTAAAADLQAPLPEDPFGPLREVLKERTWLTPRLEQELAQGARFWSLERKICRALRGEGRLLQAEAEEALRLKSFDYRAMNLLLYRMRGEEPNEAFMDFLVTSEVLVEIGDDLVDYYEDVERNSFNIYRCFLALHGVQGGAELLRFIREAEAAYRRALASLEPSLASAWLRQTRLSKRHSCGSETPQGAQWEVTKKARPDSAVQVQPEQKTGAVRRFKFPQIKPHPWHKVFRARTSADAVDYISKLLVYDPKLRPPGL